MDATRQYGKDLGEISPDHVRRYLFAACEIPPGSMVLDLACGCGYGSWILHQSGCKVVAGDISNEALDYARRYYEGPTYIHADAENIGNVEVDALVSFETLEHLKSPEKLLNGVRADLLIASVPNQERYPFNPALFKDDAYPHQRHYTPDEFTGLIEGCGYKVSSRWCQKHKLSEIAEGTNGVFLIYVAHR